MAENFNVSIPYIQMKSVSVRDSKFGQALVVHTTHRSGGYVLGFRVDPAEKLKEVFTEVEGLHKVFSANPIFGVEFSVEERAGSLSSVAVPRETDDVEIVNDGDSFRQYYAMGGERSTEEREVVFCPELGLAIEKLPEGVTIQQLWNIV
jgi:Bardet-Biedl syndrome 5 protein